MMLPVTKAAFHNLTFFLFADVGLSVIFQSVHLSAMTVNDCVDVRYALSGGGVAHVESSLEECGDAPLKPFSLLACRLRNCTSISHLSWYRSQIDPDAPSRHTDSERRAVLIAKSCKEKE